MKKGYKTLNQYQGSLDVEKLSTTPIQLHGVIRSLE